MRPGTKIQSRGGVGEDPMNPPQLLQEISDYCRQTGLAESTFGRRAVNDGKLANRLRNGGRITTDTLDRIRAFMTEHRAEMTSRPARTPRASDMRGPATAPASFPAAFPPAAPSQRIALPATAGEPDPQ